MCWINYQQGVENEIAPQRRQEDLSLLFVENRCLYERRRGDFEKPFQYSQTGDLPTYCQKNAYRGR